MYFNSSCTLYSYILYNFEAKEVTDIIIKQDVQKSTTLQSIPIKDKYICISMADLHNKKPVATCTMQSKYKGQGQKLSS
jgi:hypothetical protein